VQQVFGNVVDLEGEAREIELASCSADDPELRTEVERLLWLDREADNFLVEPVFRLLAEVDADSAAVLAPGDSVASRFTVVGLIGRGGMGDVYEARDELLNETVAIKVLRESGQSPVSLAERLRQEVQMARRISHPCIGRVHDVVVHEAADGRRLIALTMALVRGETLAQRLKRGITESEALRVARPLAGALAAAHADQVLHRDIKPGNVILEERDGTIHPVLVDFGLAQALDATDRDGRAGAVWGTPRYMAPELLNGGAATVQSDVYAFALVLLEMVCPSGDIQTLPRRWSRVFQRALQPDPSLRFGSAIELVDTLEATGRTATRARLSNRIRLLAGAAAVVGVSLFWFEFRYSMTSGAELSPSSLVVLTPTSTVDATEGLEGVSEVLRSQLVQSPHFDLVSSDQVAQMLILMRKPIESALEPPVARQVALRAGATSVVYSTLAFDGSQYSLTVTLERVGSRPSTVRGRWNETFRASSQQDIFRSLHDAALWLRRLVGETRESLADHDLPPSEATTDSWDALRLFVRANQRHVTGEPVEAAALLTDALKADPAFALAQARLADILISLDRDHEGYRAWEAAVRLLERKPATRESYRIRGQYLEDIGDLAGAETVLRAFVSSYPNDYHAAFYLGSVIRDQGYPAEALQWFDRAARIRPSAAPLVHGAVARLSLGRFAEVDTAAAALADLNAPEWGTWLQALTAFEQLQPQLALHRLRGLFAADDEQWRSRTYTIYSSWLAELGRLDEAQTLLHEGIVVDQLSGARHREATKWLHLAQLWSAQGDRTAASSAARRAAGLAGGGNTLALAGSILAAARDQVGAAVLLQQINALPKGPKQRRASALLRGHIAAAAGKRREASRWYEEAQAGATVRDISGAIGLASVTVDRGRAEELLWDLATHPARFYGGPEPELPGQWAATVRLALRRLGSSGAAASPEHAGRIQLLSRIIQSLSGH